MLSKQQKKRQHPFKRNLKRKIRKIAFMLVAAGILTGVNYYNKNYSPDKDTSENISLPSDYSSQSTSPYRSANQFSEQEQQQAIQKFRAEKNNTNAQFWIGFNGKVVKNLKDDLSGSRHQKFLISPSSDITLLVAHNIDLAPRVPLSKGDSVSIYGRYEWNNRGGVIHWTHHDPKGKKKGGWIKANGKSFR